MTFNKKWNMYMDVLQGHPTVAHTDKYAKLLKNSVEPHLPKGKCLAMGCADGMEVKALNDLGYDTIGITLGAVNVIWAKENLPDIDIRIMDFHDLKFPSDTFDCVYSDNSYEHSFAPFIQCLEVWSVLKVGGKWLIKMPDVEEDIYAGNQLDHHHPNMYPVKYHKKIFELCGFGVNNFASTREKERNEWLLTKELNSPLLHSSMESALYKRKEIFG